MTPVAYPAGDDVDFVTKLLVVLGTAGGVLAMAYWVFLLERRSWRMPTIVTSEEEDLPASGNEESERREEDEDSAEGT